MAVAILAVSCGGGPPDSRVIVLGIDGLEPRAIELLVSEGELPNFSRLMEEGAYGELRARRPLLSPVLWTTIATGKPPADHGIWHFLVRSERTGQALPAMSTTRRAKALWNVASDMGLEVATVGWWATWPPEEINGAVVSDHTCYHFLFPDGVVGQSSSAVIHPEELAGVIEPLIRRPQDVSLGEASRYIDVTPAEFDRPFDFDDRIAHLRWALATADTYRDIGLELWREIDPDLLMVYIEATDSVSHLFGHLFRAEGLGGELAEQQRKFGRAAEEIYRYADRLVGRYLEAADERTTLLVISDHGFKLGELHDDPSMTRDLRRVSPRAHREQGVVFLHGHRVTAGARIRAAKQLDVAPSVLSLLGLAVPADMPGRILTEGLDFEAPERLIATYETGRNAAADAPQDLRVAEQIKERLRSLGYLEDDWSSPAGDRALAAVAFEQGRYAEAAEMYRRLLMQRPDDPLLHSSLAGCLGAMDRYDEALVAIDRALELDPVNAVAYHNRATIHEHRGDLDAAIEDYRAAASYAPGYHPPRQALLRLTGSADARAPATDAERRAAELAERARELTRRGFYDEAMDLLDQALEIAPDYVLLYQYQSNVAYLAGDLAAAEQALQKALELEPDNRFLRRNLERLQQ